MIDKDIEILQELKTTISERECQAIENALADRKSLIEENKTLLEIIDKKIEKLNNSVSKAEIKAKIEELNALGTCQIWSEDIIKFLEELLGE